MREKVKKQKNIIIGSLLGIIFLMAVGYAAFATQLNINGTTQIASSWNILITDIRQKTKTSGATNTSASYNDLTATFVCDLEAPGDSITYEITVENRGSIDAVVSDITKTFTSNQYIDVTYSDLYKGQMLYKQGQAGSTAKMLVTVTFKDLDLDKFTQSVTSNISITLDFVQKGNNVDVPTKYLITYDSRDGSTVEGVYKGWNEQGLNDPVPTKLGCAFGGWYTRIGGSGTWVPGATRTSDVISDESDTGITLYAYWNYKKYTFVYDQQDPSGTTSDPVSRLSAWNSTNIGSDYNPDVAGYTFKGWYTQPNAQGVKIVSSMTVGDVVQSIYGKNNDVAGGTSGNVVTLYAGWTENEYLIQYDSRGGNEISYTQNLLWTDTITLPTPPTQEGYTFDCWRTQPPSNKGKPRGIEVTNGMKVSDFVLNYYDESVTLYAYWIENN